MKDLLPICYNLGILNACASYLNRLVTLKVHVKTLDACESYFAGVKNVTYLKLFLETCYIGADYFF